MIKKGYGKKPYPLILAKKLKYLNYVLRLLL